MNSWAQQIIVSVIIATLFEMILPKGKIKKYIKTVIGIYVLLVILSPIVSKATKKEWNLNTTINYEDYIKNDAIYNTMSNSLQSEVNTDIEQTYISSLKQDIKTKIFKKGFIADDIKLQVNLKENNKEEYGNINYISMSLIKDIEEKDDKDINNNKSKTIGINKIKDVNITTNSSEKKEKKANNITSSEERQIKQFLEDEYGIKKENIVIN